MDTVMRNLVTGIDFVMRVDVKIVFGDWILYNIQIESFMW